MAVREDGKETRNRLLEAACEVFSEKGYHGATVAEICSRARANVAAVNYHFGDKATLYVEAWKQAFSKYPGPARPDPSKSPEEQLREYVHSIVNYFMDHGPHGQFTRLYMRELLNPTGLIHDFWHQLIRPRREVLLEIVSRIMGREVIDEEVILCELSIVQQCRVLATVRPCDLEYLLGQPVTPEFLDRLADHIAQFSLGGIKAVGEKEAENGKQCNRDSPQGERAHTGP